MNLEIGVEEVTLSGSNIVIHWTDGEKSSYESRTLRISCQCAECVEEWSKRKLLDPASIPTDLKAEDFLLIGKYAIQFLWSDGHYTGIFPYDVLRSM